MKRILISLVLIALNFSLKAQIPISNLPNTVNPVGAYVPVARNGFNYKLLVDSIAAGKLDSVKVSNDTLYSYKRGVRTFLGVIVGGSGVDTTSLSNRINLKVNISDTASMLTGYARVQRFLDSLSAHTTRFNGVTSSLATKLNISDTANIKPRLVAGTNVTITGTYPNLTISASGGSGGISSLGASAYGLIVQNDSTYKADTIQLSTRLWRQKGIDSVQGNVNLKLNITDTANIKPRLYAGSNITISGTYPNLTIASTGGGVSDTSVFIIDTLYNRLAYTINVDSLRLKSLRMQLNGSTVTPTTTDSTLSFNIAALTGSDTTSLSNRINLKLNITDTANIRPRLYQGSNITITGTYPDLTIASSGGGATPAGNYGNVQLNRNGALATPASDSLDFDAGLNIKGALSATALPTGGADTDSLVVITSAGAFKKRSKTTFAPNLTATYIGYGSAGGTLTGSSGLVFNAGTYPTMGIVGTNPLLYFGAVSANNPTIGMESGLSLYGGATYKSINLYDQGSGLFLARFYSSGGTMYNVLNGLITSNTLSSPSNYQGNFAVQRTVPYANNLNYHGFTDQTIFNAQSTAFNSFGSFVTFGNNRFTQNHYAAFQSVWYKDSSNTMGKVYDFVSAVSEHREGTIDTLFRYKVFPVTVTGGATLNVEYGIHLPAGSASTNYGAYIEDNVGLGTTAPTAKLDINSDKFRVRTAKTPSSATDTGNAGDICWDSNYIYICVSTNSWKRVAIATW